VIFIFLYGLLGISYGADPALPLLAEWGDSYHKTQQSMEMVAKSRQAQLINRLPPDVVALTSVDGLAQQQIAGLHSSR
jgi:hypothetical protein